MNTNIHYMCYILLYVIGKRVDDARSDDAVVTLF